MGETGIPEQPWSARLAPSSCAESPGARVHVRPRAAPLPRVLPAAPPAMSAPWQVPSLRPPLPHCTAAISPLTRAHLCTGPAEFSWLSAGHDLLLCFSPLQTVPPAKVDGGLPAASLVRGEQLPAVSPSLSGYSLTDTALCKRGPSGRFQRAAWLETEAAGSTVVRASPSVTALVPVAVFVSDSSF